MRSKWTRSIVVLLCVAVLALLSSCGKGGKDGTNYLGVWVEYSEADDIYYISCAALPSVFHYGLTWYGSPMSGYGTTYYSETPGSFSYSYQLHWYTYSSGNHYSTTWYGTKTIGPVNAGQPGGFPFKAGADGADIHYNWVLGWNGSTISHDSVVPAQLGQSVAAPQPVTEVANDVSKGPPQPPDPALYEIGPTRTVSAIVGDYAITLTEYPYWPKGTTPALPKNLATK
jgi:hypothetical protein